jgi:hypothetical protein
MEFETSGVRNGLAIPAVPAELSDLAIGLNTTITDTGAHVAQLPEFHHRCEIRSARRTN